MESVLQLLSPAKLNLFLHVTGRNADGYHSLQTLFQLLDWGDTMTFRPDHSGRVRLQMSGMDIPETDNLILRAAALLQRDGHHGATIDCDKRIPAGGGLGGGSSNAATTLLALNQLWQLRLPQSQLLALGASLGADVPVFIAGHSAWAEGVGEVLTAVELPPRWYLVIAPACQVPTREIFSDRELTRDTAPITIAAFFQGTSRNDCEQVAGRLYPEVGEALAWLGQFAKPRLTGTGACIFAAFDSEAQAREIGARVPARWRAIVARGVNQSPLLAALR
jgi:4-diphosphocytidyl-2-C-methyl-D-erythritol kinase